MQQRAGRMSDRAEVDAFVERVDQIVRYCTEDDVLPDGYRLNERGAELAEQLHGDGVSPHEAANTIMSIGETLMSCCADWIYGDEDW